MSSDDKNVSRLAMWSTLSSIGIRILNLILHQVVLVRYLDMKEMGQISIALELLLGNCMLVGGRNALRLAMNSTATYNYKIAYQVSIVGSITSLLLAFHHYHTSTTSVEYRWAGLLYGISAMMEYMMEPYYLYGRVSFQVSILAQAEVYSILTKVVCILYLLLYLQTSPLLACGISQLSQSLIVFMVVVPNISLPHTTTFPKTVVSWYTIGNCMMQCLFQYALTQGDRIVLSGIKDEQQDNTMGIYAISTNYGSIISRLLFQPLEEQSRLLFASSSSATDNNDILQRTYMSLLKLVVYIGMIFATLASNYTSIVVFLLLPSRHYSKEMIDALTMFCFYILILAMNGITEAFVYAMLPLQPKSQKYLLIYHGCVAMLYYIYLTPILLQHYHAVGLILANAIAMLLRILYSLHFASHYFAKQRNKKWYYVLPSLWMQSLPHPILLGIFTTCYYITYQSNESFQQSVQTTTTTVSTTMMYLQKTIPHIFMGITCLLVILLAFYQVERPFRNQLKSFLSKNEKQKTS